MPLGFGSYWSTRLTFRNYVKATGTNFDTIRCRVMSPFASAFAPNILKSVKLAMHKHRARAVAGSPALGTNVIRRHRRSAPLNLETKTTKPFAPDCDVNRFITRKSKAEPVASVARLTKKPS
jgi:hypothetical protein